MNTKLIATVINAVISFIIIVPISFLMNKFINDSEMTFMEFFNQKWGDNAEKYIGDRGQG